MAPSSGACDHQRGLVRRGNQGEPACWRSLGLRSLHPAETSSAMCSLWPSCRSPARASRGWSASSRGCRRAA